MVIEQGAFRALGTPVKLSRTPGGLRCVPPRFAADSEAILRNLGFDDAVIAELRAKGVAPAQMK